jgi:DUF971 family protein
MSIPHPTEITLHRASRVLEIAFSDGAMFRLPCEFLRIYSPSAEVRGHGPGQEVLQMGKREVEIAAVEPVGSYAVRLVFSDGHDTGLYSWEYLHHLGMNQDRMWRDYLERLAKANASRDSTTARPRSESAKSERCQLPSSAPRLHHRLEEAVIRADMSAEVQR